MEMSSIERRQTARFSTSIPVGLRFPSGPHKEGWGRILNLSPEGLFLETRFQLRISDVVYASFSLKNGAKFDNLRTHVIRLAYEEGYFLAGIAFDDIVDQQTLRDVIGALAYEGGLRLD
jgi:hypothetical protein